MQRSFGLLSFASLLMLACDQGSTNVSQFEDCDCAAPLDDGDEPPLDDEPDDEPAPETEPTAKPVLRPAAPPPKDPFDALGGRH